MCEQRTACFGKEICLILFPGTWNTTTGIAIKHVIMHDKLGGTQNIGQGKGRKKIHKRSASADTPNWAEKLSPFVWSFFDTLSQLHFGGCGVERTIGKTWFSINNFYSSTIVVGSFDVATFVAYYFSLFSRQLCNGRLLCCNFFVPPSQHHTLEGTFVSY